MHFVSENLTSRQLCLTISTNTFFLHREIIATSFGCDALGESAHAVCVHDAVRRTTIHSFQSHSCLSCLS